MFLVDLSSVLYFISKHNRMNNIWLLFSFSLNLRSVSVWQCTAIQPAFESSMDIENSDHSDSDGFWKIWKKKLADLSVIFGRNSLTVFEGNFWMKFAYRLRDQPAIVPRPIYHQNRSIPGSMLLVFPPLLSTGRKGKVRCPVFCRVGERK
jgi:hypothetical protein